MDERDTIITLAERLESVKEQIKNLVVEQEALQSICVLCKEAFQKKYQTLEKPQQLLQDYEDPSKRGAVIDYLKQYMKMFFPQSNSIDIQHFVYLQHSSYYYRITAIIDGEYVRLDVPTYEEEYAINADHYSYILSTDLSYQVAFDPAELIQIKHEEV